MSSSWSADGLAGWELADTWGIEFEAPHRQLGRMWMAGGAVVGVSVPFSLGGRLFAAVGAAIGTHLMMWAGAYLLINRMARVHPKAVPMAEDEVSEVADLAGSFAGPIGLSDWSFERVGGFETASTMIAEDGVESLVTISRVPGDRGSEERVTLGFVAMLSDGRFLVSFLQARPLIPYMNTVQLFDPKANARHLWERHLARLKIDGDRASRGTLEAIELRHVPMSIRGALRFFPEWTGSIRDRAGELHA